MATAKVMIIVSRNGSWVWKAEAHLAPELVRPLSDREFVLVKEALPRLIESLLLDEGRLETQSEKPQPVVSKRKK